MTPDRKPLPRATPTHRLIHGGHVPPRNVLTDEEHEELLDALREERYQHDQRLDAQDRHLREDAA